MSMAVHRLAVNLGGAQWQPRLASPCVKDGPPRNKKDRLVPQVDLFP